MKTYNYTEDSIKGAIIECLTFSDVEMQILANGDKNLYNDYILCLYSFVDHIFTRLGFGDFEPYKELAGVKRDENNNN